MTKISLCLIKKIKTGWAKLSYHTIFHARSTQISFCDANNGTVEAHILSQSNTTYELATKEEEFLHANGILKTTIYTFSFAYP